MKTQLTLLLQELANFGCDLELLNCKSYNKEFAAQRIERGLEWKKVMMNECDDFAAACVDPNRFERIIERNREVFSRRRVQPDCILAPPGTKLFISMVSHGARAMFQTFGPDGTEMFVEGPPAAGIIRGDLVLFEGREYDVNSSGPAILPLQRDATVGEAYVMSIGSRRSQPMSGENAYRTAHRDLYIFDASAGEYKKVSFAKAFLHSGAFMTADGAFAPDPRFAVMAEKMTAALSTNVDIQQELQSYAGTEAYQDTILGDEASKRAIPLMISHDPEAGNYFVPRVLGQFDVDVINTSDIRQMAETIYEKSKESEDVKKVLDGILAKCSVANDNVGGVDAASKNAFAAAFPDAKKREKEQQRLGLKKDAVFSPYSVNSLASPIQLKSPAAFLWGSVPLGVATESLLYSPINVQTGKLEPAPKNNRVAKWLEVVHKSAAASGKEDPAFRAATSERMQIFAKVSTLTAGMTPANAMSVREAMQRAFESNVAPDGTYKEGKSLASLEKDLTDAGGSSQKDRTFAVHENVAASAVLSVYKSDYAINPFASTSSAPVTLNAKQMEAVNGPFNNFTGAKDKIEERVILHGMADKFDAENPSAWLEEVEKASRGDQAAKAALKATKSAVESFERTHRELAAAISQHVLGSEATRNEEDDAHVNSALFDRYGNFAQAEEAAQTIDSGDFFAAGDFYRPDRAALGKIGTKAVAPSTLIRGAMAYRQAQATSGAVPAYLVSIYNKLLLFQNRRDCWQMLINADIHVPFNLILWRLWIRHSMYTCVMMKSGLEMGGTIVGQVNYAVAAEVTTKTLEGHVTFNHASIVWNDRLVLHMPNVIPRGYRGGWNNVFIESREEIFNTGDEDRGSLLVTLIPVTENSFQFPLNFVPKQRVMNSTNGTTTEYKDKVRLYGTYSSADFYEALWGLKDSVAFSEAYDTFSTKYTIQNTIAYEGKSWSYSPADRYFSVAHEGTGHLSGNRTGRGCMQTWEGNATMFPDQSKITYRLP